MQIPLYPPKEWFDHPGTIPTDKRITIEDTGRVYGYVALFDTCHSGIDNCVKPPKGSPSNYGFAHQGETQTSDGTLIATANIGGGGHASMKASPEAAAAHYQEHTSTQLMRVKYGEDQNGIWFAGSLWPDVNEVDLAHIRASSISGDWRWFSSWRNSTAGYDFAGACFVNVPGYPVDNAGMVAKANGSALSIAASLSAFMPGETTQEGEAIFACHDPMTTNKESNVSCKCNEEPKCPCGQKPASECPGGCEGIQASVDTAVEAAVVDPSAGVEQPKLPIEGHNDMIASMVRGQEEVITRIGQLEEVLTQMVALSMAEKLAQ